MLLNKIHARMKNYRKMENQKCERDFQEPKTTYKIVYIIHFLLGAGNLLPWNTLITAVDYFGSIYPDQHIEKVFSVAYMVPSVIILVFMLTWSQWSQIFSFRFRMNLGFSMFIFSLMVTPIMDWTIKFSSGAEYYVIVVSVVICGLADGLIGGSLVGSAGKLPKQYMQAIFAGTASSGVLICVTRIITKASLPHSPDGLRNSAHFYFTISSAILIGCIICSNLLYKLPMMQEHYAVSQHDLLPFSRLKFWEVAKIIQGPAFGIFLIYTVTLSIFPGFLAEEIESNLFKDWYPIVVITLYNLSDFIGKSLTAMYTLEGIKKAVWSTVARLLFYPMFTTCFHGPKWLRTEVPMMILTIMLGVTNGYLTSVLMILAPKMVPVLEAEVAAVVMAVFLALGLVTGSVIGWFWII